MEENKGKNALFGGINNMKFKKMVVPGDRLKLEVKIIKRKGPIGGHGHGMGMGKGEKAKDSSPGVVVLAQMEHRPNTLPSTPPALGPSSTAPRITGICMVVALITGTDRSLWAKPIMGPPEMTRSVSSRRPLKGDQGKPAAPHSLAQPNTEGSSGFKVCHVVIIIPKKPSSATVFAMAV